jgi:hypothetical protein
VFLPALHRGEKVMNAADLSADDSALPEGRFGGRSEFGDLIRRAFRAAASQGWREIIICDADFDDWPLGERAVTDALGEWSRSGRKLTMIAKNYDVVIRRHPRFVTWRRTWSHIVECRAIASGHSENLPSAMWTPAWVFERLDLERSAGYCGHEAPRRVALREGLNERLLKSVPAFPATTLGL